jgi:hypothetical protein
MLSREKAAEILKAAQLENPNVVLANRIKNLEPELAQKTLDFLMLDSSGKTLDWTDDKYWEERRKFEAAAQKTFYAISQKEFDAVLNTWFPRFADVVREALKLEQVGWTGYRSPNKEFSLSQVIGTANNWRSTTQHYDQSLEWYAEHASYLYASQLIPVFVAAVNMGNTSIFEMFMETCSNEHPVSVMGDHVIQTLLQASNPKGWEMIEKLLFAAQRQEGLRQSIFNAIASAHPKAIARMLHVILEHDLLRFSSSVQWAQGYLPLLQGEPTPKALENALRDYTQRFENPDSSRAILKNTSGTPDLNEFYLATHTIGRVDISELRPLLLPWTEHQSPEMRFAALHLLFDFGVVVDLQTRVQEMILDTDDRVAIQAFTRGQFAESTEAEREQSFAFFEAFLTRFPEKITYPAIASWLYQIELLPETIVGKMFALVEKTNPRAVLKYRTQMSSWTQSRLIETLTKQTPWDSEIRDLVMQGLSSKEESARDSAINAINTKKIPLEEKELLPLEKLLSRKTAEVRKQAIGLILNQIPSLAASSAARLQMAKTPEQKKAGTEILQALKNKEDAANQPTALDGYGLFDPKLRSPAFPLEPKNVVLVTSAALKCLESLTALIESHWQTVIDVPQWDGSITQVPFNLYTLPVYREHPEQNLLEQWQKIPLREVWENWFLNRSAEERDTDSLEIIRAATIRPKMLRYEDEKPLEEHLPEYQDFYNRYFANLPRIDIPKNAHTTQTPLGTLLHWFKDLYPVTHEHDFALDVMEDQLALMIPAIEVRFKTFLNQGEIVPDSENLKHDPTYQRFLGLTPLGITMNTSQAPKTKAQQIREWQLTHTTYQRLWWSSQRWIVTQHVLAALQAGVANQTDVMDALIGPNSLNPKVTVESHNSFLAYTKRKPHPLVLEYPQLKDFIKQCVDRILEIELKRGDLATVVTKAVGKLEYLEGTTYLVQLLQALGRDNIVRGSGGYYYYGNYEKPRLELFSSLLKVCYPAPTDTAKDFAKAVEKAGIPEQRLLELGLFAPQWIPFVAAAIAWKGLDQAMYWLLAHTKESGWGGNQQELEGWKAEMAQLTPLTSQDLMDGAVDVAWFNKVYKDLGETRWTQLYDAAKYTSSGTGHARAKQFADAMLGKLSEADVQKRILEKRHQDSLRAFGLLPLPKTKDAALLKRYETVQTFIKGSKQFGSQRKESEGLAARIGLENLARTAGFPDPMRLEWAMEIKAVADLSKGAVKLQKGDVEFILSVSEDGEPNFEILKNGKTLKDIPANLKKDEAVLELRARRKELENQRSRMRVSLERAMVHGDEFTAKELRDLTKHPIVKPMLEQLVFIGETQMGFLSSDGKNLVSPNGELLEMTSKTLRLAHPVDLLESGTWSEFQGVFFSAKRQQPFKQIFRELYLLTEAEKLEKTKSSRYAGHQINHRQSVALLGSRNWVIAYEGDASRTFFAEGITAHVGSKYGWTTPAEVEAPALDTIHFTKRGHWESLDLETIPKRLYSEVMRDLDLVVSVAHVGGVDPEASQSTTEMRAALLLETLRLLKLENVKIEKSVALIQGSIGRYSVHLGSAVVHQQPGGAICLVAVPNQARGRIFLPFADSDPRTAEVIAKVLMLAKDSEIQDPVLLRQLVG